MVLNMVTLAGQSLLRHIENQDVEAVSQVVQNGIINLDERDEDGQTFLMIASRLGEVDIVKQLLAHQNVDVKAVDNDNWSALLNAAKYGHHEVVTLLLDVGATIEHKDIGGWTALLWACYKGRTEVAQELLSRGANANVKGEHAMSCLTWAAGRGHTDIVRALLRHEAQVNTADKYGTTPLIWAARKGHTDIVDILLKEGATVDNSGMNSWTALIVAANGGYTEVVRLLMEYGPDVNVKDKDGLTPLALATKDGHLEIVKLLLQKEAYVNIPDRYGDTILIHAVKGGHQDVVKALLRKYADVDVQGVDHKTALYWAVDKKHLGIAKMLLDINASTEIATKDGDTPLLKAVRSRNNEMVLLLLEKGAKISAHDKKEDTALHIAVRGRSKRITEALLRNPKDGRLLYKPNKAGETPYQIDASHDKSILTQVFGTRNLNADENISGYDLYSSTIADVLSEPSLHTPITVGLYAKWGSGKSFLIERLIKEMKTFTKHNADILLEFTGIQFAVTFILCLLVGLVLGLSLRWEIGLGVGLGLFFSIYCFYIFLWFGTNKRGWDWTENIGVYLARKLQFLQMLLQVLFCHEPKHPGIETAAVKFLFTNNARLASVVGEKSITAMISTLCVALEDEYGIFATRLYRVFKPKKASENGRFKSLCCVPYFLVVVFILLNMCVAAALMAVYGVHSIKDEKYTVVDSVLIAIAVILAVAIIANVYTWSQIVYSIAVPPQRRVQKIGERIDSLKMEGFMQALKKEVELMGQMTRCTDAFLGTHTRLVVIVDGLDSCEQEKLLQVLDTVHMLFSDSDSPFITILAVDPHVIINGIEHNLSGLFRDSSISGHDYLRNIVHLPFYLQSQTLPRPQGSRHRELSQSGQGASDNTTNHNVHQFNREAFASSSLSIPDTVRSKPKRTKSIISSSNNTFASSNLAHQTSQQDLTKQLGKNSYFSDVNPRNMKRLMNIIAVTGRLMHANHVDFNWHKLAVWANITEQWPYRLSWIILEIEDNDDLNSDDTTTLKAVYDLVKPKLPTSKEAEPLVEIDRNARKLEIFLGSHATKLTIGDLRSFMPCTINVDPYLRKLIREYQQSSEVVPADFGLYGGGGAELMAWPGQAQSGIHLRSRSRHESGASRNTPTRPIPSRASQMTSPAGFPPMFLHPQMLANHMYASQMNAFMQGMPGFASPGGQACNLVGRSPTPGLRSSPRVQVQGGLDQEKLSSLSVDAVCNLLERLEGINQHKLTKYVSSIKEHNISGVVLLNCELSELKPIMLMSFGDWELFRALVQTLREREVSGFATSMKQYEVNSSSDDVQDGPPPLQQFTQTMHSSDCNIQIPNPQYPPGSPAAQRNIGSTVHSETTLPDHTDFDGTDHIHSAPSLGGSTKNIRSKRPPATFAGGQDHRFYDGRLGLPAQKLNRKDSFIGEVMMEAAALRGVIAATGVQTDSDEDGNVSPCTPIPEDEEKQIISPKKAAKAAKHELKERQKKAKWEARQQDLERERSQEREKAVFAIEDDDDDSDAEELERLSRKSSFSNLSGSSYGAGVVKKMGAYPTSSATVVNEVKISTRPNKSHSTSWDDGHVATNENIPLVPQVKAKSRSSLRLNTLLNRSKESVSEEKSSESSPPTCKVLEEATLFKTTSGTSSIQDITSLSDQEHEAVALRKLTHEEDPGLPSAFKPVTPGSSRASSRSSVPARPLSQAESTDAVRLHINEGYDDQSSPVWMPEATGLVATSQDMAMVCVDGLGTSIPTPNERHTMI